MALNPSWKEFSSPRQWPTTLEPMQLTSRLLRYFDLPEQEPVSWFEPLDKAILYLERSYLRETAHVDPLPYPTKRPRDMHLAEQRQAFGDLMLATAPEHIQRLLSHCRNVKLVLIRDFPLNHLVEGVNSTFEFIIQHCPVIGRHVQASGSAPPILRLPAGNNLADVVYGRRGEITGYLEDARPLDFR